MAGVGGEAASTGTPLGMAALAAFAVACLLVALEDHIGLRKSKPMLLAATAIWGAIAWAAQGDPQRAQAVSAAFERSFLEFSELFFFLVASTAFVEALAERGVFDVLRVALIRRGWSWRGLFWITGALAFALSSVLNNMTTALVMAAVVLALGAGQPRFVAMACINIVVAANAGGAWCAFGDVTTLMVWQAGHAGFFDFFALLPPALVSWLLPAALMHPALPSGQPQAAACTAHCKPGTLAMVVVFALTIALTVACVQLLALPPMFGMLAGLALLQMLSWRIGRREATSTAADVPAEPHDIFRLLARNDWDTLLFFGGVLLAVGGLAELGWIELLAASTYGQMPPALATSLLGASSALIDNIPVMSAVLHMAPPLDRSGWLLVTLACGVGGSLLSIGSAAGIALMGVARGSYTFTRHLRWSWAIALGYVASVALHLLFALPHGSAP